MSGQRSVSGGLDDTEQSSQRSSHHPSQSSSRRHLPSLDDLQRSLRQQKRDYQKSFNGFEKALRTPQEEILLDIQGFLAQVLQPAFSHAMEDCDMYLNGLCQCLQRTPLADKDARDDYSRRIAQAGGVKEDMVQTYEEKLQYFTNISNEQSRDKSPERFSSRHSQSSGNTPASVGVSNNPPPVDKLHFQTWVRFIQYC